MTVQEFLDRTHELDVDIDVYDGYDERLGIAWCGSTRLTEEGCKEFAEVLKYNMYRVDFENSIAVVDCDTEHEAQKAYEFFVSAAGYCASDDWERWFE